jgi:hypothetical protein
MSQCKATNPVLSAAQHWAATRSAVRSGAAASDDLDRAGDRLEAAGRAWQKAPEPQADAINPTLPICAAALVITILIWRLP